MILVDIPEVLWNDFLVCSLSMNRNVKDTSFSLLSCVTYISFSKLCFVKLSSANHHLVTILLLPSSSLPIQHPMSG